MDRARKLEYTLLLMAIIAAIVVLVLAIYYYRNQKSCVEGSSHSLRSLPCFQPRLFFSFSPASHTLKFKKAHALQAKNPLSIRALYFEILILDFPAGAHLRIGLCSKDDNAMDIEGKAYSSIAQL